MMEIFSKLKNPFSYTAINRFTIVQSNNNSFSVLAMSFVILLSINGAHIERHTEAAGPCNFGASFNYLKCRVRSRIVSLRNARRKELTAKAFTELRRDLPCIDNVAGLRS